MPARIHKSLEEKEEGFTPHRALVVSDHHRHPRRDRDPDVPQPAQERLEPATKTDISNFARGGVVRDGQGWRLHQGLHHSGRRHRARHQRRPGRHQRSWPASSPPPPAERQHRPGAAVCTANNFAWSATTPTSVPVPTDGCYWTYSKPRAVCSRPSLPRSRARRLPADPRTTVVRVRRGLHLRPGLTAYQHVGSSRSRDRRTPPPVTCSSERESRARTAGRQARETVPCTVASAGRSRKDEGFTPSSSGRQRSSSASLPRSSYPDVPQPAQNGWARPRPTSRTSPSRRSRPAVDKGRRLHQGVHHQRRRHGRATSGVLDATRSSRVRVNRSQNVNIVRPAGRGERLLRRGYKHQLRCGPDGRVLDYSRGQGGCARPSPPRWPPRRLPAIIQFALCRVRELHRPRAPGPARVPVTGTDRDRIPPVGSRSVRPGRMQGGSHTHAGPLRRNGHTHREVGSRQPGDSRPGVSPAARPRSRRRPARSSSRRGRRHAVSSTSRSRRRKRASPSSSPSSWSAIIIGILAAIAIPTFLNQQERLEPRPPRPTSRTSRSRLSRPRSTRAATSRWCSPRPAVDTVPPPAVLDAPPKVVAGFGVQARRTSTSVVAKAPPRTTSASWATTPPFGAVVPSRTATGPSKSKGGLRRPSRRRSPPPGCLLIGGDTPSRARDSRPGPAPARWTVTRSTAGAPCSRPGSGAPITVSSAGPQKRRQPSSASPEGVGPCSLASPRPMTGPGLQHHPDRLLVVMIIIGIPRDRHPTFLNQRKNGWNSAIKTRPRQLRPRGRVVAVDKAGTSPGLHHQHRGHRAEHQRSASAANVAGFEFTGTQDVDIVPATSRPADLLRRRPTRAPPRATGPTARPRAGSSPPPRLLPGPSPRCLLTPADPPGQDGTRPPRTRVRDPVRSPVTAQPRPGAPGAQEGARTSDDRRSRRRNRREGRAWGIAPWQPLRVVGTTTTVSLIEVMVALGLMVVLRLGSLAPAALIGSRRSPARSAAGGGEPRHPRGRGRAELVPLSDTAPLAVMSGGR